ncbi:MAG: hypothetical protein JKY95_09320, partial [Planctomycetaceae bacterium]|nr:hypothetical protein [Planctomycetaceae bacterium]
MKIVKNTLTLFVLLMCGLTIGCGGAGDDGKLGLVSAKGKVTLDGAAHGPATLTLTPTGQTPGQDPRPIVGGVVEADGSYALATYDTGDGAPPGDYDVTLGAGVGGDANDPTASAM